MSRHPYTHSCDWIREFFGPEVSRSDASKLRQAIANELGIDDEHLASVLSMAFMRKWGLK